MAKSSTELELKVTANARSAASGLRPLETSLKEIKETSHEAEKALDDLGDRHKVNVDDDELDRVRREITRLREQMRHDLRMDVNADTRTAQTRIRQLRSIARELEREDVEIDVDIDADTSGLRGAADDLRDVERAGSGMGGKLTKIGAGIGALAVVSGGTAAAIGAIALPAGLVGGKMLGLADRMANAKIAFEQFLGSGAKAEKFLSNLQQFAAATPFEFPELVDSSKQLLAFGVEGGDVIDIMTTIGDAAALTGQDVGELTTIYGQMIAKGKVSNEELLQLTERGIPAYQLLADKMGKTVPEIQKMAEQGKLLSDTTMPKLQKAMDETFGGGMAKQAETLGGKVSTLKDTFAAFGTEIGTALTPFADAILTSVQPALDDLAAWARENKGAIATTITDGIALVFDAFGGILNAGASVIDFFGTLVDAVNFVSSAIGDFLITVGDMVEAANSIPGVGAAIPDDLGNSLQSTGEKMKGFGQDASDMLHGTADGMRAAGGAMGAVADKFREKGAEIADSFKGDELASKIQKVRAELKELGKKPPSPQVDADIRAAQKKLRELRRERREWSESRAQAKIDAKVDSARTKIKEIRASLKYLRSQKATPEIKAKIDVWKAKLREVQQDLKDVKEKDTDAKVKPMVVPEAKRAAIAGLDAVAKPPGGERNAPIKADVQGEDTARTTLDNLADDRHAYVYVHTVNVGGGGGGGGGAGVGGRMAGTTGFLPQATNLMTEPATAGRMTMLSAGRTLAAEPVLTMGRGGVAGVPTTEAGPTQLVPKQTPVLVLLDGQEIASHVELRARRFGIPSGRRRP